jgi:CRISPR-associated protein Cas1
LDGENLVCKINDDEKFRIPFDNIENIVCFSYLGCSPALMGKCVSNNIPINFMSPYGKFLAKVCGETKGNVFLRVAQIDVFRDKGMLLIQNTLAAKFSNNIQNIKRTLHDNSELRSDDNIHNVIKTLEIGIEDIYNSNSVEQSLGIEGNCAKAYFSVFDKLIINKKSGLNFQYRNKRPPLDPVNALLSFVYTLFTNEYAAALETVGLDSYIGFYHSLRSGRSSLACDLIEETRCLVERFVLTLINLQIISEKDFDKQISGAVWLNDEGRKKVIAKWQEKKRSDYKHPYLNQKIPFGLIPYVQSNLLAKYVRGDINEYPCFLVR